MSGLTPPDSLTLGVGEYYDGLDSPGAAVDGHGTAPVLRGLGACGGSATAPAAVLMDVTESHRLTPGAVLVTRQTDPGWGPIFPLVSGLVIERGGMLSHGAIIAREFGIPSVVGVKDATRVIAHGTRIRVDGDRGVVQIVASETARER
jgi:pyruvate,water dikinase